MTSEQIKQLQREKELEERNRYLTDEELDAILPQKGYEIVKPPENYKPIRNSNVINGSNSVSY